MNIFWICDYTGELADLRDYFLLRYNQIQTVFDWDQAISILNDNKECYDLIITSHFQYIPFNDEPGDTDEFGDFINTLAEHYNNVPVVFLAVEAIGEMKRMIIEETPAGLKNNFYFVQIDHPVFPTDPASIYEHIISCIKI